jgi:hypothetical protein
MKKHLVPGARRGGQRFPQPPVGREAAGPPSADQGLVRRDFIGASGVVGGLAVAALAVGKPPAAALLKERAMILQLARAGVTFPVALPAYNEPGPPSVRAIIARLRTAEHGMPPGGIALALHRPPTMAGLRSAERRMPTGDLARARAGADLLIAAGLRDVSQAALLEGVGRHAAQASGQYRQLLATVTLAIATVFPGFNPTTSRPASQWLSVLANMYRAGTLRPALNRRGAR